MYGVTTKTTSLQYTTSESAIQQSGCSISDFQDSLPGLIVDLDCVQGRGRHRYKNGEDNDDGGQKIFFQVKECVGCFAIVGRHSKEVKTAMVGSKHGGYRVYCGIGWCKYGANCIGTGSGPRPVHPEKFIGNQSASRG